MNFSSTNYSHSISAEWWFIPVDIFMILCTTVVVVLAVVYLLIIAVDKTCHTNTMLHVVNSCSSALIVGCVTLGMGTFSLQNDLQQVQREDSLCVIRAYLGYSSYGVLNFSFFLQALHRYMAVVHASRSFFQSVRCQALLICGTWIFGFAYPSPMLFSHAIVYNADNQICQKALRLAFYTIYGAVCGYGFPITLIVIIYVKLVRYVKDMSLNVVTSNTLMRAKRELKMVRRIVVLIIILLTVCFPYTLIMFMSFFNRAPKYHFRIAYIFVDASILSVMISLFQSTDVLKASVRKKMQVLPSMNTSRTN